MYRMWRENPKEGRLRLLFFILASSSLLCAPATAGAQPLSWSAPIALSSVGGTDDNALSSVSCPSVSQCTAVDYTGQQVTFDPNVPGTPTPTTIDSLGGLTAVACPSTSQCTAVGESSQVTFDPTAPGIPTPTTIDGLGGLGAIACPSIQQCTAVDYTGQQVTFDPTAPGSPTPTAVISPSYQTRAVACPSADQCTVVDFGGRQATFDPTAPGSPTMTTIHSEGQVEGLACPSTSQCTAVGASSQATFDPTAPGTPTPTIVNDGFGTLSGVACPSTGQCTAVNWSGQRVTFDPTAPGSPTMTTIAGALSLSAVACPSTGQCTAVNWSGRQATFDPTAPGGPAMTTIDSTEALRGVSCPSAGQCTAIGNDGRQVTFDPTSPGTPTPTKIDNSSLLSAVACPSISQCTAVSELGRQVTFDPTASGSPIPTKIDDHGLLAVACPATDQCTAVGELGRQVTFDPTGPGSPTPTAIDGSFTLSAVACPSTSQCTAVDYGGRQVTFDPTAPGNPMPTTVDSYGLLAVACPATDQCTAVGELGRQVTFDPTAPGTPTSTTIGVTGDEGMGLACPSIGQCTAVGEFGRQVTFDPREPGVPTPTSIGGANLLTGIACSSVARCVAVDAVGKGFVGTSNSAQYDLAVIKGGAGSGTVVSSPLGIECGGVCLAGFPEGEEVTLSATADEGSTFAGWSGSGCTGTGACKVTMSEAREVTATFLAAGPPLTLVIEAGAGTVVTDPGGFECSGTAIESCATESVAQGIVTLTASPAPGYLFKGWRGCDKKEGEFGIRGRQCAIDLTGERSVGAKFVKSYDLKLENGGGGKISSKPGGVQCMPGCSQMTAAFEEGAAIEVVAQPSKHFHLAEWVGACTGSGSCSASMVEDRTVAATFAEDPKHVLSLAKKGGGQGLVKAKSTGINCGYTCTAAVGEYYVDESAEITVTLGKGTSSVTWVIGAGSCTGNALACSVPMSADHELVAKLE